MYTYIYILILVYVYVLVCKYLLIQICTSDKRMMSVKSISNQLTGSKFTGHGPKSKEARPIEAFGLVAVHFSHRLWIIRQKISQDIPRSSDWFAWQREVPVPPTHSEAFQWDGWEHLHTSAHYQMYANPSSKRYVCSCVSSYSIHVAKYTWYNMM